MLMLIDIHHVNIIIIYIIQVIQKTDTPVLILR